MSGIDLPIYLHVTSAIGPLLKIDGIIEKTGAPAFGATSCGKAGAITERTIAHLAYATVRMTD